MTSTTRDVLSWAKIEDNPHCMEIVLNEPHMQFFVNPTFDRILHDWADEMPYVRRENTVKTSLHWGQRKLLMSEIEFLNIIGEQRLKGSLVVYAGAAPGTHIPYLCDLFPEVEFMLVDPAPFRVEKSAQVGIIQDLFTDELAIEIKRRNRDRSIFFISDIRTADPDLHPEDVEERVKWDQAAQMRWHQLIGAKQSMLKFRLPWDQGQSSYLAGDIYLPVWGPQTTTEARLITLEGAPSKTYTYDNEKYERQMMYFNNVTRHSMYQHDVRGEGLDHCYDCAAEIRILKNYIRAHYGNYGIDGAGLSQSVTRMSYDISRLISRDRTLLDPTPDPAVRKAGIRRTQYRDGRPAHERAEEAHRARRFTRRLLE